MTDFLKKKSAMNTVFSVAVCKKWVHIPRGHQLVHEIQLSDLS